MYNNLIENLTEFIQTLENPEKKYHYFPVLSGATFSGTTGIVIGFDMTGTTLPAGDGVLATLSFAPTNDAATLSASNVTVSTGSGNTLLSSGPASGQTDGC